MQHCIGTPPSSMVSTSPTSVCRRSASTPPEQMDASLIAAPEKAAAQIRDFHQREVRQSWFTTRADGTLLGVQVTPVRAPASTSPAVARSIPPRC